MTKLLVGIILITIFCTGCTKSDSVVDALSTVGIADMSALESSGVATLVLQLSTPSTIETSITVRVSDDTAKSGVDYINPTLNKIFFPAGVVKKQVSIILLNDHAKRADRSFKVELSNSSGISIIKSQASVRIINDNLIPDINFSIPAQVVSKAVGDVSITLELSYPLKERVDIPYVISGTASYGMDYRFPAGVATFFPGEISKTISGTVINTQTVGLNKTIIFTLVKAPGVITGPNPSQTIVIVDGSSLLQTSVSGTPVGVSNQRILDVSVSGANVSSYKYKITSLNNCDDQSGYSQPQPINQKITDSVFGLPDGVIFLCVEGGNQGVFQSAQTAKVISWSKNTNPPSAPIFSGMLTKYRELSPGNFLSNVSTTIVKLSSLTPGYFVGLYDSSICATSNLLSKTAATALEENFSANFSGDGDHSLSVRIFDQFDQGSSCVNAVSKYTIDTVPPIITEVRTSSQSGFFGIGSDIQISVIFSKTVSVTGPSEQAPYLTLNTTPNASLARFVSTNLNILLFDYQPALFQNSVKLDYTSRNSFVISSGVIQDLAGNTAILTLPAPGTIGSFSSKASILVDTGAPSVITGFSDGSFGPSNKTPIFSWNVTTDSGGSGVAKYQISIGSSSGLSDVLDWTDTISSSSFSKDIALTGNQTYYASVRAIDRAGNISDITQGNGWQVDSIAPSIPTISVASSTTYSKTQSPSLSWNQSTDAGSGLDHYEISLGSAQGLADVSAWNQLSPQVNNYVYNYNGQYGVTYFVNIRAVDRAGNISDSSSGTWSTVKPNTTPTPEISFPPRDNVRSNTQYNSFERIINGLDINVLATVTSDRNTAFVVINNGAPVTSGLVKNGDVVSIQLKSSSGYLETTKATLKIGDATYEWRLTTWGCPNNYVLVPGNLPYLEEFCVSKYKTTTIGGVAVSQAGTDPTATDQFSAQVSCQNLGSLYDQIGDSYYQRLANEIEIVDENWSSGTHGVGTLSGGIINSAIYPGSTFEASSDDNDACHGSIPLACSSTVWNKYRRTMKLSNGSVIWDFSGGRYGQWIPDFVSNTDLTGSSSCSSLGTRPSDGHAGGILTGFNPEAKCIVQAATVTGNQKLNFGTLGDYSYPNLNSEWGGLGYFALDNPSYSGYVWTQRGGSINDESGTQYWHGGIYTAIGYPRIQGTAKGNSRCVYTHP
jgi:hypothetical protein